MTSGRIHEIEFLTFDIVLVVLHQYVPAINDMSCAIDIHGYLVDIGAKPLEEQSYALVDVLTANELSAKFHT